MEQLKIRILEALGDLDGFLPLTERSKAETIRKTLGMDKTHFQQAVNELSRENQIEILQEGIRIKVKTPAAGRMFRQVRRKRR